MLQLVADIAESSMTISNDEGQTPLEKAKLNGSREVAQFLKSHKEKN